MLHLENFFEKSFALLLTTPKKIKNIKKNLTKREFLNIMRMMSNFCNGVKKTPKNRTFGASCGTDTHSVRNSII